MAVLIASTGGPEGLLREYWKQTLEDILKNQLMASDLMEAQVIPANSGRIIEFRRINSFAKQVTGVSSLLGYMSFANLKGRSFVVDSIVYTLELLTNDLQIDETSIMSSDPSPIPVLTDRFLYNVKDTLDQRAINIMVSNSGSTNTATTPSVEYFGASRSVAVTWGDGSQTLTEATLDADIPSHRVAAETFNSAYTALRSRSARTRRAAGVGRAAFDCLVSPEIAGDLRTDGTFQDIALKGDQRGEDKFERAMIGEVFGVRVIEDENVSVNFPGTVDTSDQIVRCPVVGEGYVARISHATGRGTPQVNFLPPGKADKADPYGLVGILTWKIYQANGGVLNPLAGQIIKVATTRGKSVVQDDDSTWQ